ncbi:hypothetical protein LTR62_004825 [Meristemomyces frigidus]|uniref:Uncharacterized protein n=1 Tax=Meristemomyces frigidus TaxID=1508187 RepID=A0AAN7YJM7_9PEZI|nr:hypothetical protein LTR62_004825 [Meristemomyces frigidus]
MSLAPTHAFIHQTPTPTQDPQAIATHLEDLTKRLSIALTRPSDPENIALLHAHLANQICIGGTDQDDTHGLIPSASLITPEQYIAFAQARKIAFPGWQLRVVDNLSTAVDPEDSRRAVVWLLTRSTVDEKVKQGRGGGRRWRENICKAFWRLQGVEGRWVWWKYEMMDGPAGGMCGDL